MSLQLCPQCRHVTATWYCDDNDKDRWLCLNCDLDCSEEEYNKQIGEMTMTTTITNNAFETKFGKFCPTDRETYKKIKRIRHLFNWASAEADRWNRAQRRQPHNRKFVRRRDGMKVKEPISQKMIFTPFYEFYTPAAPAYFWEFKYPADAKLARATDLYRTFMKDYENARHPKDKAEEVKPLLMSPEEIDDLLRKIEAWFSNR